MNPIRLSLILLLALPTGVGAAPVVLHVSPDGADTNTGTTEKPLRTPAAARNAVRKLRAAGAEPITVLLHKGTYYLEQPLVFTPADSGSPEKPVVYAGAPGEEVTLSGGTRLNLVWEDHRNGIKKAKVPPEVATDQLFVNGERQHLARYPNYDPKAKYFNGSAADAIARERVKLWADPKGGVLHAMHKHEWGGFHYVITGKNPQGEVTLDGGWQNNRQMGMHDSIRFVENIFEELDAPGEWLLDSRTRTLYFYPPKGLDLSTAVVEAARLRHLVEFKGSAEEPVRGITIKNVTFRHATRTFMDNREPLLRSDWTTYRGGAIFFTGCEGCALEDCGIHQVGGNAVFVNTYNRRVTVRGCSITEAGGNGVAFVGDPKAVRSPLFEYDQKLDVKLLDTTPGPKTNNYPAECLVEDCLITRTGRVEKQSAPVQISMAQSITVRHCSIYDVPRAGINVSEGTWGGHVVEFCDVFDTVQETGDHGSFNSWGRDRYWVPSIAEVNARVAAHPALPALDAVKPIVLRNNRWRCDHGWDIDLDDGSSNYHIYNNLCLNGGLKLREGYRRIVENNVIVNNSFHPHVWYADSGDVFARNVVGTEFKPVQMPKVWGKSVDSNLFPDRGALSKAQALGTDPNSQAGDPLFVGPAVGDYRVKDGSPALKLGFKNFPMDQFGVTSPRLRAVARTPKLHGAKDVAANTTPRNELVFSWHGARLKNVVGLGEVSAAGLPGEIGVLLVAVPPESGAGKAGLKQGDVIVKFDGKPVADAGDLLSLDCTATRGPVKLGVWRDQKDATVVIELGPKTVLRTAQAELTGEGRRPVYDAKKDYLGAWSNQNARVSWKTTVPESATYSVQLLFACQPSSAGGEYELVIGGKTIKGTVRKTGSWEDFALEAVGRVELKKGEDLTVSLRPVSKPAPAVMNLRAVILEPVP